MTATYFLSAFYHWNLNPFDWTADNRLVVIGIYLCVAVFAFPISLVAYYDIEGKGSLEKEYINKEFAHNKHGKIKVIHFGVALKGKKEKEVDFVRYKSLENGHIFDEYLTDFQENSKMSTQPEKLTA